MFESLLPDQNNTWNTSFNQPFTNSGLNLESTSEILPPRTNSAFSQPEIDLKNLTCSGDENLFISHFSLGSQSTQALNSGNYNSTNSAEKSAVDPLTGEVLSNDIVEQALQSAQGYLKGFATAPDFNAKMNLAFGNSWNAEVASKLVQEFTQGNFSNLPEIEILPSATLDGANGAFATANNTIYLSQEFIAQNAGNPEAITSVLLEETGHYIDSKINVSDTAGDEGDIFARLAQGQTISADALLGLKAEDDTAVLKLNGQVFWIEQSTTISQVTFRTFEKNKYVVAEGGGGSTVNANRDVAGLWENFTLIDLNGGSLNSGDVVNIRSQNGSYVVAEGSGGGVVNANRRAAGPWEEFQVIKVNGSGQIRSGDSLALRAKNGQYVVAEGGGGANVNANRNAIGPWEKFIINFRSSPYVDLNPPAPRDNAGNSTSTANNIGTFSGFRTFSDFIGTSDTNDYYRFNLSNNSNFSLTLNGLSGDADVQLLDSNGNQIQASTNGGTTADTISRTLNAGTYYVRVYPMSGVNTNYNLSLTATQLQPNEAPRIMELTTNKTTYNSTETLSLSSGWVYDGNGASDLSRVDFQIRRPNGTILDVSDATSFTPWSNDNRWARFNYSLSLNGYGLGAGNHTLRAIAYDKSGAASSVLEQTFTISGGYYSELASFDDNRWDQLSGDNILFDNNTSNGESPEAVKQVLKDLSRAVLGTEYTMNAGYAYDTSYKNYHKVYHAGIDFEVTAGTPVKAVLDGTVAEALPNNKDNYGAAIIVNSSDGRQWVYGHLQDIGSFKKGTPITSGQKIGQIGNQPGANHLHISVLTTRFGTGKMSGWGRDSKQEIILDSSMSPLQAYWQLRNK